MHRKHVAFIIITIVTMYHVINAIQEFCNQAGSDAVPYLQYEDNNNDDVFEYCRRHGFGFPGILSLLKPPPPHLHHSWFHNGCQTGFFWLSASYQSCRNLISQESCLLQENRSDISLPDTSRLIINSGWINRKTFSHCWLFWETKCGC